MSLLKLVGVTGANGGLGSLTIEALIASKFAGKIVAISRDPTKTKKNIADHPSVTLRKGDFSDVESLKTAFVGLDRLLVISSDAVGTRVAQHKNAFKAAKEAGVKHIAYTSITNAQSSQPFGLFEDHHQSEEALKSLGVSYSILRNNFYTELFVGGDKAPVSHGHPVLALEKGKIAFVTKADCARAAAGVLSSSSTESKTYDITGPASLSVDDIAKTYSEVLNKEVKSAIVTADQLKGILEQAGVPAGFVGLLVRIQELTQEGLFDVVSNDVETLSGRKPDSYKSVASVIFA